MEYTATVLTGIAVAVVVVRVYLKLTATETFNRYKMAGKTVIVTGANSGIGVETALELAMRRARVILACHNMELGNSAAEDIMIASKNSNVLVRYLDLSSLDSVRRFASNFVATEARLDVLIHNAAILPPPGRHITKDNLELQFQTNHFGPFLLNNLLLDLLKQSAPSRIVVVSSEEHFLASLDLDNLNCEKYERTPSLIHSSTKLANLLFTRELNRRLKGTGVTVNALHPGYVQTSLFRDTKEFIKHFVGTLFRFGKDCQSVAQTAVYLASSEDVENVSGKYFVNCKKSRTAPSARDDKLASEFWDTSEKLTGIKP